MDHYQNQCHRKKAYNESASNLMSKLHNYSLLHKTIAPNTAVKQNRVGTVN